MLKNVTDLLVKARMQGYCIPAVRVVNPSGLIWCFEAAHQMNAPVIARCDSRYISQADAAEFAKIQEKRYPHVQLALVVDGIKSVAQAAEALKAGATGLCITADAQNPEEIIRFARAWGIGVEAANQFPCADLSNPADAKHIKDLREKGVCQVNVDFTPVMVKVVEETLADEAVKPRFLLAELDVRMKRRIADEIIALMHLLGCRSRQSY